jgi:uncharacterized OB-fold protein
MTEVFEAFPDVLLDYDNIGHFEALLQRQLLFNRCQECGYWIYPHRPMCRSDRIELREISGSGTIYMFTFSYAGHRNSLLGEGDVAARECWAAIELPEREGLRYLAPVVSCAEADIHIGMRVKLDWQDRDGIPHPVFRRAEEESGMADIESQGSAGEIANGL